jgi:hypothetical protein
MIRFRNYPVLKEGFPVLNDVALQTGSFPDPEEMLTPDEVSAITKLKKQTLAEKRWRGTGPVFHKLGTSRNARVRYKRRDVTAWMAGDS